LHARAGALAEDDPLPTFDKRQALANQLGMTPRSVQIWFQNRRQRLLNKPELAAASGTMIVSGEHEEDTAAGGSVYGMAMSDDGSPRISSVEPPKRGPWGTPEHMAANGPATHEHSPQALPPAKQQQPPPPLQHWEQNFAHARQQQPSSPPFGQQGPFQQHLLAQQSALPSPAVHQTQPGSAHPFPVTAAHLVHACAPLLRGAQPQQQHLQQPEHHASPSPQPQLPLSCAPGPNAVGNGSSNASESSASMAMLMSSLGRMMMSGTADPTIAIHHALAMLPRAVAAGQVTPGAAALLMQAVHQQMGMAMSMGEQQPQPSQSPQHPQPPHQPQPFVAADSQPYPVETASAAQHVPEPPRAALPSAPGGQELVKAQAHMQAHGVSPTAPPAASTSVKKPLAPANDGVDGLLLLSACADFERQTEQSSLQVVVPSPIPHFTKQAAGNNMESSQVWHGGHAAACVPSVV